MYSALGEDGPRAGFERSASLSVSICLCVIVGCVCRVFIWFTALAWQVDLEARVDQALGGAEPQAPAPTQAAEQRPSDADKAYTAAGAAAKEPAMPDIALRCPAFTS